MNYHYTDAEIKALLKTITVLCDTREKKDEHILKWLDSKAICYKRHKLDFGDYSLMVPANGIMKTTRDTYFTKSIVVERKAHLEELSDSLAQNRGRFENEFLRAKDCRKILIIERGSISDIWEQKYNTQFKPASYMASLLTFQTRYGLETMFITPQYTAQLMYGLFYYHLKEVLESGSA